MKKIAQVLLIDDDTVNNFLNLRVIDKLGLAEKINICVNGEDAIHFLERQCIQEGKRCPEVILLDLNMPVMNGFEFLEIYKKLKFKKEHVEIVILTSSEDDRDFRKVESLGVHHYLNKPLVKEKFLGLVEELY